MKFKRILLEAEKTLIADEPFGGEKFTIHVNPTLGDMRAMMANHKNRLPAGELALRCLLTKDEKLVTWPMEASYTHNYFWNDYKKIAGGSPKLCFYYYGRLKIKDSIMYGIKMPGYIENVIVTSELGKRMTVDIMKLLLKRLPETQVLIDVRDGADGSIRFIKNKKVIKYIDMFYNNRKEIEAQLKQIKI